MRIKVKEWWYGKEQSKAQCYNWTLCWERVFKDENNEILNISEELGKMLYNEGKVEYAGYALFGEKVKETEKAVQYRLKFWNLRKTHRYITDAPIEEKWLTWIPKSVLL